MPNYLNGDQPICLSVYFCCLPVHTAAEICRHLPLMPPGVEGWKQERVCVCLDTVCVPWDRHPHSCKCVFHALSAAERQRKSCGRFSLSAGQGHPVSLQGSMQSAEDFTQHTELIVCCMGGEYLHLVPIPLSNL